MSTQAGRSCPITYRYGATAIAKARARDAEILYVVGGLYGNIPALNAIEAMAKAHLVIGRAGASTIAELTVMGRPSILVPLPHALDNDQLNNAKRLAANGGALAIEQKNLTIERMAQEIGQLLDAPDRLAAMAAAARNNGRPNAVVLLANLVEELMGRWVPATV